MKNKTFEFSQNWENDGMLVWKNAKTLNRYQELCRERDETDVSKFRCFFAFSQGTVRTGSEVYQVETQRETCFVRRRWLRG